MRPTPWSDIEVIASWIASQPRELDIFAQRMTLHARRLLAAALVDKLGEKIINTEKYAALVSPHGETKDGKATWGLGGSVGESVLGISSHQKIAERQARATTEVDEWLSAVTGFARDGQEMPLSEAESAWGDRNNLKL